MKRSLLISIVLVSLGGYLHGQNLLTVSGTVVSQTGQPLAGVNIVVKGTTRGTSTNAEGKFSLQVQHSDRLIFSFIGYTRMEVQVGSQTELLVRLEEEATTLGDITIVSTGYQQLPRERVNGSFVHLGEDLINRRVSTDLLARLEDITSGLIFNRNVEGRENDISIRGMSTINSNAQPLIVVDNFPYDGDLNNINPADIQSITVLKDAAAASIWGARAGNGVIVVTTKKGLESSGISLSFKTNVTISDKPDLFYVPRMSSREFIEVEKMLFDRGFYVARENSWNNAPLTPAVELMIAHRDGLVTEEEMNSGLEKLATYDIRDDYERYFYRKAVDQQYALSLSGGAEKHRYYVSAGFDKNANTLVENSYHRLTLSFKNRWLTLSDKLQVSTGVDYSESLRRNNNDGPSTIRFNSVYAMYPYARLRDEFGNNLPITSDYRIRFVEQAESKGFLNWNYVPLDELSLRDNTRNGVDYRINTGLNYRVASDFNVEVLYQYRRSRGESRDLRMEESYYTRNLINRFTFIDGQGNIVRPVPWGSILDVTTWSSQGHSFRSQLNFTRSWRQHSVSALAGYEVREVSSEESSTRYYGYDHELARSQIVDYVGLYDQSYFLGVQSRIPNGDGLASSSDRNISYYANAGYDFKKRYSLSGSARRDQSNLFGVKANQRGVPLWSVSAGWEISGEPFYDIASLPYLKVRTTYGYNGNINTKLSAFTTAFMLGADGITGRPYGIITNPPNPHLKWERVRMINAGVDFELKESRVSGSVEFYWKEGLDLIGTVPYPPATGVTTFTGNTARTAGRGFDVTINSINIDKAFKWNTTFLLSSIEEKVTEYEEEISANQLVTFGTGRNLLLAPLKGRPLYSVYSYRWAGLHPETGDPQGYLDGVPSTDYSSIVTRTTPETLVYHGPARPKIFGALRNNVSWKNFELSFNITYRLGYYFRNASVLYSSILTGVVHHGDYSKRWQKPGDEKHTNVPSMPSASNNRRDDLYAFSEVLVEKGDHVRLQDVRLSYSMDHFFRGRLPLSRIEIYTYLNNVGIVWKSASGSIDPDYYTVPPPRSIAFGVRVDF